jgi:hypothetical protein
MLSYWFTYFPGFSEISISTPPVSFPVRLKNQAVNNPIRYPAQKPAAGKMKTAQNPKLGAPLEVTGERNPCRIPLINASAIPVTNPIIQIIMADSIAVFLTLIFLTIIFLIITLPWVDLQES